MKCIMLMFDTLNRHMLPVYNRDSPVHAPNFSRLAHRTATFHNSYVCSMPCMPARRDLHTGRPNFLHRSWGPLEPFDDSVPQMLKEAGVSTHLFSDHYHYWEDGGCTYHTKYSTWRFFRGQEGDPWMGQVADPPMVNDCVRHSRQDRVNRQFMRREQDQPQAKTFKAGLDFIRRNADQDNWLCHIETFDPHEPFFTQRKYKDIYFKHYHAYAGRDFDWPPYRAVCESPEEIEHCRHEYAALMTMCDAYLGDVLDVMDELSLWDQTMLVVWTDHGFLLSEHESWAKCWAPFYQEIAHTPFFVWDPREGGRQAAGQRREALVQPAIDLGPTLLEFFGLEPTERMLGHDLAATIADDTPVREAAMFGIHGGQVNVTDGRYVYMRGRQSDDATLYDYTLMPTHMTRPFSVDELAGRTSLHEGFGFTRGCAVLQIGGRYADAHKPHPSIEQTLLWDVQNDPLQQQPIEDAEIERRLSDQLVELMRQCEAPPEQFERMGLSSAAGQDAR